MFRETINFERKCFFFNINKAIINISVIEIPEEVYIYVLTRSFSVS